jgi:hypothetical protein
MAQMCAVSSSTLTPSYAARYWQRDVSARAEPFVAGGTVRTTKVKSGYSSTLPRALRKMCSSLAVSTPVCTHGSWRARGSQYHLD